MATAPPFTVLHLDHVVLRVRDAARLERFYREVIGCSLERRQEELGLTQLRAGSTLIDLVDVDGAIGRAGGAPPGREGRNMDHFCLRIEPFDSTAIAAHLKAHGITPGEVQPRFGADGRGPSLYFDDPEGNRVELKGSPDGT
ncbi:MAG TPA: VOC family protein [Alphaproteobacteria bacterium]|nr:VOC family protein [Alphaproteobacteria bacterium]